MMTKYLACLGLTALLTVIYILSQPPAARAQSCEYWVAPPPEGDDGQPGTFAQPWATLAYAAANLPDAYCTVWFKDGVYAGKTELETVFTTTATFKALNPYMAILENSGTVLHLDGVRNVIFEGFEFRHAGPSTQKHVVLVDRRGELWSEGVTFRNNIFHDSYNNDLLKINNGVRFATVENNIFYNQGDSEQHMDVNSVTDVVIQDNIFFNDFAGSGRSNTQTTKHFIMIKDSNENEDGLEGSERITVRRNIFLSWEGGLESFVKTGNDGKPYHEAEGVVIANNLMIGNATDPLNAAFGVRGAKNITFTNNTVIGDLPAKAYAYKVSITGLNPPNENLTFANNIWADPSGTMGAEFSGSPKFSGGDPAQTLNLTLDNNLYWNGGAAIPAGKPLNPLLSDTRRLVADPLLNADQAAIVLPRWNGSTFLSGNRLIRQEFERLVALYGRLPAGSPAIGQADPALAPPDDILGRPRTASPDLGAYEYTLALTGTADLTTVELNWSDPHEPEATSLAISYTVGLTAQSVTGILTTTRAYTLTDLWPFSTYTFTLTARDEAGVILAESNALVLSTAGAPNQAPAVDAGLDQTITLPDSAALDGTVSDDGLPAAVLTTTWSLVSGPGPVTFTDAAAVDTAASFAVEGRYILQLTADDGALTNSDRVSITVHAAIYLPLVLKNAP